MMNRYNFFLLLFFVEVVSYYANWLRYVEGISLEAAAATSSMMCSMPCDNTPCNNINVGNLSCGGTNKPISFNYTFDSPLPDDSSNATNSTVRYRVFLTVIKSSSAYFDIENMTAIEYGEPYTSVEFVMQGSLNKVFEFEYGVQAYRNKTMTCKYDNGTVVTEGPNECLCYEDVRKITQTIGYDNCTITSNAVAPQFYRLPLLLLSWILLMNY
jgi:hypothetical protein